MKIDACEKCAAKDAEIARMKAALQAIWDETDDHADGAEDASRHDKLCARVSDLARGFIKPEVARLEQTAERKDFMTEPSILAQAAAERVLAPNLAILAEGIQSGIDAATAELRRDNQ